MFVYKKWDSVCQNIYNLGINSTTISSILDKEEKHKFLCLKHDVESTPRRAYKMAKIESEYFHKGTYYVQASLLHKKRNVRFLKKIQSLGHEVSYHHDVLDNNNGDYDKAIIEFNKNIKLFMDYGFEIKTVCQHGNPIARRVGYHSNRDFFRRKEIQMLFPDISEVMVDYKKKIGMDYIYISDAGYSWNKISDPENNDKNNSSKNDVLIKDFEDLITFVKKKDSVIISTHPHRWSSNILFAFIKIKAFGIIRYFVKKLMKIPIFYNLMSRFFFLAKKI